MRQAYDYWQDQPGNYVHKTVPEATILAETRCDWKSLHKWELSVHAFVTFKYYSMKIRTLEHARIKLISTTHFAQSMVLLRPSHSRAQVQYNIVKEMSLRERDKLQRTISPLAPLIAQPTFVNQYTHSAIS